MRRGLFITFEGPDGSGKSTQISLLKEALSSRGVETVLTREPGGTKIGERIRSIILDPSCTEMDSMTETLLYAASRAQHVSQVILPAIEQGKSVICDRFVDSSIAYQGFGRGLGEQVKQINQFAVGGCEPNITFLMQVKPEVGKRRIRRELDRLELENEVFHEEVLRGYLKLAEQEPKRIVVIDAARGIQEIALEIQGHIDRLFAGQAE